MSAVPTVPEMLERLTAMRLELLEMLDRKAISPRDVPAERERIVALLENVRDTEEWARDLEGDSDDA